NKVTKSLAKEVTLEKPTGPVNSPTSGGFKSYFEERNLLLTDYLLFHANGNAKEINRLLEKLNAVGKKTAIGFGKIKRIKIDRIEKDYYLFTPDHKRFRHLKAVDFKILKLHIIVSTNSSMYCSTIIIVVCFMY